MTFDIGALLSGHVFGFVLVFARVGTVFMLLPGIGEPFVMARARLLLAVATSFLLLPVMAPDLPKMPEHIAEIARLLFIEVIVGLFFGTILRFLVSALETAGLLISMQIGLSNATMFNPAFATQGTLPGAMLSTIAVLLLFMTGMEEMLLRGMVGTYDTFKPGVPLIFEDIAGMMAQLMSKVFALAVQLAIPFLMVGLLTYVPLGVMNRMMPQLQVLAVAMPLQIWVGLIILAVTIATIMMYWLEQFDQILRTLLIR
ncbi:MAG: flagellar biosynthetic protein FliR [Alphaproteobacteria bacterium]